MENWISAKDVKGITVKVRQGECFSKLFIGEDGTMYDISDLDFTQVHQEEPHKEIIPLENVEKLREWLFDNNADHKASIEERAYWRKLRGEVFMKSLEKYDEQVDRTLNRTKYIINQLYDQDKMFNPSIK